jgi:hypothetical protein
VRVSPHGNPERAREAEVGQLEVVARVDEEVLRLQVAVEDAVGVAVEQAEVELVVEFLFTFTFQQLAKLGI